jgi:SAM-dependent MidA family methyltransferase
LAPWIFSISDILEAGVVLLIDYGFPEKEYYHPQRSMGTLMCHYRHYAHTDPFLYPGLQDITAHVNFTHVAEAALQSQLEILGYTHQAAFLLGCGLTEFLKIESINEKDKALQNSAVHKLTSPAEMGELFKVIALGRQFEEPLIGFSLIDKRYVL